MDATSSNLAQGRNLPSRGRIPKIYGIESLWTDRRTYLGGGKKFAPLALGGIDAPAPIETYVPCTVFTGLQNCHPFCVLAELWLESMHLVLSVTLSPHKNTHDAPRGPSCENMTSSRKPEIHNVLQRPQTRTSHGCSKRAQKI